MPLLPELDPSVLLPLAIVVAMGGLVRGFAGFGAGLIIMPVASALIDPRLAAAVFLVTDTLITLPMLPPAVRNAHWPTVAPTAIGALLFAPVGAFVLISADVLALRWGISALILAMLMLLVSGWRYKGDAAWYISAPVGAGAGFLGGVAQIAGPPVVTFWMAGPLPAKTIRANLISFFAIATIGSAVSYFVGGLFTEETIAYILVAAPIYALAVWAGTRFFGFAPEIAFRRVAYGLIVLAALSSLPVFDQVLRS